MSDTFAPDSSFGLATASFSVSYQDSRSRKSDSLISVRPLPFGGGAVVQSGGLGPRYITFKVYCDSLNEARLEAARGYHGVLTCWEGTFNCTLMTTDSGLQWVSDSNGASGPSDIMVTWVLDD